MESIRYEWNDEFGNRAVDFVRVRGTNGHAYSFGESAERRLVDVNDFFIGTVPVTQALWNHVMGPDMSPALNRSPNLPLENVSWNHITQPGGFLECINNSKVSASMSHALNEPCTFRLPSETEWEYAARGGSHWTDGFLFSGSNNVDDVAWYDRKHGDHTQPVALKAPNQLGIFDMSGNVWEWCEDSFTSDTAAIPEDGSPVVDDSDARVLRGGCFHNWAIHCTVSKRYSIERDFHDGCIGLRLVLSKVAPHVVR